MLYNLINYQVEGRGGNSNTLYYNLINYQGEGRGGNSNMIYNLIDYQGEGKGGNSNMLYNLIIKARAGVETQRLRFFLRKLKYLNFNSINLQPVS